MAKIIEKDQRYAGVIGKIFDTMNMDSDSDAPSIDAVKDYVTEKIDDRRTRIKTINNMSELDELMVTNYNKELNLINSVSIVVDGQTIPSWSRWFIPSAANTDMIGFIMYPRANGFWILGHVSGTPSQWGCKQIFGTSAWIDLNPTGTVKYRIRNGNTVDLAFTNFVRIGGNGWVEQLTLPVEIRPNLMLSFNLMTNNSYSSLRMSRISEGKLLVHSPTGTDDPLLGSFSYGI